MEVFFHYLFGTPSFSLDWAFRMLGGLFGLMFFGLLLLTVLSFFFNAFKSARGGTFKGFAKAVLRNVFGYSAAIGKVVLLLFLLTVALKECRHSSYDNSYFTD